MQEDSNVTCILHLQANDPLKKIREARNCAREQLSRLHTQGKTRKKSTGKKQGLLI